MTQIDRIIELDIDALGGARSASRAPEIIARLEPLWRDAAASGGTAGLVLNLGWLMDPIVLFSGDPDQMLPIRSARLAAYASVSYRDLAHLVADLRVQAREKGIADLRIGMLVLGIGEFVNEIVRAPGTGTAETLEGALYRETGEWYARHPELFPFSPLVTLHGPGLDWRQPLGADPHPYASRPHGIVDGESFAEFFAAQWAALAQAVGFDVLLLRDETTTPVHAGRMAFDGSPEPTDAASVDEWTSALIAATSALKREAPGTLLALYSSGLSPTVELRFGRLDIERVVAEGGIDVWIDQTWGGAWQDWWDAGWQGWSFQLSNLLARAALIAAGNRRRTEPCRHYPLFQLLDGWEPYDTLHDYPDKLRWGIWAFSHASVHRDGVDSPPPGAYLAVANDRTGQLIDASDVAWISETLRDAAESAASLERVLGPVLVVPGTDASLSSSKTAEAVEDAVGFLGKWAIPALSATTSSMLDEQDCEGLLRAAADAAGGGMAESRDAGPILIVGAPEDLGPSLAAHLGISVGDEIAPSGYRRGSSNDTAGLSREAWPYMGRRRSTALASGGELIYDGEDGPTAVRSASRIWWLPPHVANGADRRLTHYQIGTVDPHAAVAWALARLRIERGLLAAEPLPRHETLSLHGWVSGGVLHVLLGNVESGWIGDSRYPRSAVIHLPREFVEDGDPRAQFVLQDGTALAVRGRAVAVTVPAEGFVLGRLRREPEASVRNEGGTA